MQTGSSYSAQEYALFFQRGEEAGFSWFFRQLYASLSFFACRITGDLQVSEEIASMAFMKIWKRHHLFSDPGDIRAYLYQIVRNDSLKWLNKKQRESKAFRDINYLWADAQQRDHFQKMVEAETTRQLMTAIDLLPPECGKVFRLLYVEGKSVKETAAALQLSVSTVKTQKKRGLHLIRLRKGGSLLVFVLLQVF